MERAKQLGDKPILSLLVRFSTPAIVGMAVHALYNVVDRAFLGQTVGRDGIAAVTVAFPFMLIILAFGMLIGFGATALISIRLGQQRKGDAELVLGNAVVLLLICAAALTTIGLVLLDPLILRCGATKAVLPLARDYLEIIVAGTVFQILGFGLNACIRGEGNPTIAMVTMLIGALLNIVLDAVFIVYLGWGVRGAAVATVISQAVSAAWVLAYFLRGKSLLRLRTTNLQLQWPVCWSIIVVGSPLWAHQMASSVLNMLLNSQLRFYGQELGPHGGELALSAMGIVWGILMFVLMPVIGISQGAQPIIGYNHGAKRPDRVRRTLQLAVVAATGITITGFAIARLCPAGVIGLFNNEDQALMELGSHALRVCLLMLPTIGFQIIGANYFQAVGKPKHTMFLTASRQIIILIPALLILPYFFGLEGIWIAMPVADLGSAILTALWLWLEWKHLPRDNGAPAS